MIISLSTSIRYSWCGFIPIGAASALAATPALQGQSGYINMPSAVVEADGTFSAGYSYDRPYGTQWASSTILPFLPFLQVTGRYVPINGVAGFTDIEGQYGKAYGRYKDKFIDAKLKVWSESAWLPSLGGGCHRVAGHGTVQGPVPCSLSNAQRDQRSKLSISSGPKEVSVAWQTTY